MLRVSAAAETAGVPSVTIVGSEFMKQAAVIAKGLSVPLAIATYPGAPMMDGADGVRTKVIGNLLPEIIQGLTACSNAAADSAPENEPHAGSVVFRGTLNQVQNH